MIWVKRHELQKLTVAPGIVVGATLTAIGCSLFLIATVSNTILLEQLTLIITILGLVWLLFGRSIFKAIWVPLSYLVFAVPLFSELLKPLVIHLQLASAALAALFLKAIDMPVFRSGILIGLPHISLKVARGCSGINHIVALFAIGVPLALFTKTTKVGRAIIILASLGIGIPLNGLRIALIGIWTYINPGSDPHGPMDLFLVSFVFTVGFVFLLFVSSLTKRFLPNT